MLLIGQAAVVGDSLYITKGPLLYQDCPRVKTQPGLVSNGRASRSVFMPSSASLDLRPEPERIAGGDC